MVRLSLNTIKVENIFWMITFSRLRLDRTTSKWFMTETGLTRYSEIPLAVDSENDNPRPKSTDLKFLSLYPNPFNHSIMIGYYLPYDTQVRLDIYNIAGPESKILRSRPHAVWE